MKRFKRILCYIGTDSSEAALSRAVSLAIQNEASLTIMDVIKPIPKGIAMIDPATEADELQQIMVDEHEQSLLARLAEYADTAVPIELVVATGDPATEIIRQVILADIDLVIKNADGVPGLGGTFGSVARSLLRMCPCPVWLLKPEIHGQFDRVLAAIDLDADDHEHQKLNRDILDLALSIAQSEQAQLHLVAAWGLWMEGPLRKRMGDETVDQMVTLQQMKVRSSLDEMIPSGMYDDHRIQIHLHHGDPSEVIRSVADTIEADLMVMGTVCRSGVSGALVGNTADTIFSELSCSMLAIKPAGFLSPVQVAARV
ncbi:UspA domain-containing protein [Rhodopirellula maiorica SM1]|uniref:UspA domain-containing protein n=2 Tax=Novipirellula TaxID=2795426 RepID=M5RBQ6_9BACT|nr:UspA domain-containing protein [Rhodopirellula maiorica SM1]